MTFDRLAKERHGIEGKGSANRLGFHVAFCRCSASDRLAR